MSVHTGLLAHHKDVSNHYIVEDYFISHSKPWYRLVQRLLVRCKDQLVPDLLTHFLVSTQDFVSPRSIYSCDGNTGSGGNTDERKWVFWRVEDFTDAHTLSGVYMLLRIEVCSSFSNKNRHQWHQFCYTLKSVLSVIRIGLWCWSTELWHFADSYDQYKT